METHPAMWCRACGTVTTNMRCDCNSWPDGHEMKREPNFVNYDDPLREAGRRFYESLSDYVRRVPKAPQ